MMTFGVCQSNRHLLAGGPSDRRLVLKGLADKNGKVGGDVPSPPSPPS
jgi:hypothetical protein